jgi:hypothetical protein
MALLGLEREDDVPGWLIPSLYFNYLRLGQATPLEAVFRHNARHPVDGDLTAHLAHVVRQGRAQCRLPALARGDEAGQRRAAVLCKRPCPRRREHGRMRAGRASRDSTVALAGPGGCDAESVVAAHHRRASVRRRRPREIREHQQRRFGDANHAASSIAIVDAARAWSPATARSPAKPDASPIAPPRRAAIL